MNRVTIKACVSVLTLFVGVSACGTDRALDATLGLPEPTSQSVLSLHAALDVSQIDDSDLVARMVIDEINIHVADVRLLSADPRMPTGGLALLDAGQVLTSHGEAEDVLQIAIPALYLEQEDLALYLRIDQSTALGNSAVVVRGRIYSQPVGAQNGLTASPDPDGDPADEPEPLRPWKTSTPPTTPPGGLNCAPDPDGDPANPRVKCTRKAGLKSEDLGESVEFELRDGAVADMIADLDPNLHNDWVVAVPAARWFSPEAVAEIEGELSRVVEDRASPTYESRDTRIVKLGPSRLQDEGDPRGRIRSFSERDLRGEPGVLKIRRP